MFTKTQMDPSRFSASAMQPARVIDPLIRLREFLRITGLGRSTVYKLIKENKLERPVRISARTVGWRASTVTAFLDSRTSSGE